MGLLPNPGALTLGEKQKWPGTSKIMTKFDKSIQALRVLLTERPRLTADEIGEALQWDAETVRRQLHRLITKEEGASLPKRYELTSLGARRTRLAARDTSPDAQRLRGNERMREYRARLKVKREAAKALEAEQALEAAEREQEAAERIAALAANDGMVARAKANAHPLAMAWR